MVPIGKRIGLRREINRGFALLVLLGVMATVFAIPSTAAQVESPVVQSIQGNIDEGIRDIDTYSIPQLTGGNVLYINANGTSGNLDTYIALVNATTDIDQVVVEFSHRVNSAVINGTDYITAVSEASDELFLVWDDDSAWGYGSKLAFNVTVDGDYKLFVASAINKETFGDYELLVGLNAPEVLNGDAESTGGTIAILVVEESGGIVGVQETTGNLNQSRPIITYFLRGMNQNDTLYLYIEALGGGRVPQVALVIHSEKVLASSESGDNSSRATMQYTFIESSDGFQILVIPPQVENLTELAFRIQVGVNAPDALTGEAPPGGRRVLRDSITVFVGVEIDQITNVDQKAENFAVVANLWLSWRDPRLAYRSDVCGCSQKVFYTPDQFVAEYGDVWPSFTILNQQERRWTQNQYIVVYPDGSAIYFERFWTILQAPDFDFRRFPNDVQTFYVRVLCVYREEIYHFEPWTEKSRMGSQLGEEEWRVIDYSTTITSETLLNVNNSEYAFGFTADRHQDYYYMRIYLPIGIIFMLTWLTWIIKDYGKRLGVATGNLLLFIAFNFTIANELPRLGYLTNMDKILISIFIWTSLVVVYNLYLSRLEEREALDRAKKLERVMIWAFPLLFLLTYFVITLISGDSPYI